MISPGMEHMEETILRSRAFFKLALLARCVGVSSA